jgi:hypothetical protein
MELTEVGNLSQRHWVRLDGLLESVTALHSNQQFSPRGSLKTRLFLQPFGPPQPAFKHVRLKRAAQDTQTKKAQTHPVSCPINPLVVWSCEVQGFFKSLAPTSHCAGVWSGPFRTTSSKLVTPPALITCSHGHGARAGDQHKTEAKCRVEDHQGPRLGRTWTLLWMSFAIFRSRDEATPWTGRCRCFLLSI